VLFFTWSLLTVIPRRVSVAVPSGQVQSSRPSGSKRCVVGPASNRLALHSPCIRPAEASSDRTVWCGLRAQLRTEGKLNGGTEERKA
jgi:hypothetical protein